MPAIRSDGRAGKAGGVEACTLQLLHQAADHTAMSADADFTLMLPHGHDR
jgi:hypothetical protein